MASASITTNIQPAEPSLVQRLLMLESPEVATLPGGVAEPTSVIRQQGWVDGAQQAGTRGLIVGAALGALVFWWAVKR